MMAPESAGKLLLSIEDGVIIIVTAFGVSTSLIPSVLASSSLRFLAVVVGSTYVFDIVHNSNPLKDTEASFENSIRHVFLTGLKGAFCKMRKRNIYMDSFFKPGSISKYAILLSPTQPFTFASGSQRANDSAH